METIIFQSILPLIGGLAFFIFGMNTMSGSLEKMAGGKLEHLLKKMTANPIISMLLGIVLTVAMQSSSATTVMLVGLANSGILHFSQTVYICFGANIGTTLTGWILSLAGIEGNGIIMMLKPTNFSPVLAFIGIILIMFSKTDIKKSVGHVLLGFAVLMYGMDLMGTAVEPLESIPEFQTFLGSMNNPFLALLVSLVFTAIIQSSAATLGILQALSATGILTYNMVIPMVMGLNIGTCATSLLSCIGTGTNAKRVAFSHLMLKVLCTLVCFPILLIGGAIFHWEFLSASVSAFEIALLHTLFNIILTILFMPFTKQLVKLVERIVRDKSAAKQETDTFCVLDERVLNSPSIAVAECGNLTKQMSALAHDTLKTAISVLYHYDGQVEKQVLEQEDKLDLMEDRMGTYLVRLSAQALSQSDSREISKMLHSIGDFERLGDHAVNLMKTSKEMQDKGITFSEEAKKELAVLTNATLEIMDMTYRVYRDNDSELAVSVEPLEQVIDALIAEIKDHHIKRLRAGNCTIELGFILSDLLNNYRRISDHCSNIAVTVIEVVHDSFDTHQYLNGVKYGNAEFNDRYEGFHQKYQI